MEEKVTRKIPAVTVTLIAVNVLIWLVLELIGDTTDGEFMLAHGAAFVPYIIEDHEWWRLFTSMFLHFGADHLLQNMLILLVIGCRLERITGKLSYLLIFSSPSLTCISKYFRKYIFSYRCSYHIMHPFASQLLPATPETVSQLSCTDPITDKLVASCAQER